MPPAPAASIATSTNRAPSLAAGCALPSSSPRSSAATLAPDPAPRVAAVLVRDDLLDPLGRLLDLSGLVDDDVVVVILAGQLDRRVALAQLELVGRLARTRAQPGEQRFQRWRDHEDQQGF